MTTDTKVILGSSNTARFFTSVAVDAFLEAVFLGAYSFDHRLVTVSVQNDHVVAAHVLGGFDTLLTLYGFCNNR